MRFLGELGDPSALGVLLHPFKRFLQVFSEGTSRGQSDLPRVNTVLSTNYCPR